MHRLTIVGSGPTAIYLVARLLDQDAPFEITMLEREDLSGTGMPFRMGDADVIMLANIADIEIPPLRGRFLDWVRDQPADLLAHLGVEVDDLHDRSFLPRVLLGAWLRNRLGALKRAADAQGKTLRIVNNANAVDIARTADRYRTSFRQDGEMHTLISDNVVLATGHDWSDADVPEEGYFATPWPSAKLAEAPAGRIGVIGASLSGIDAAMAAAARHGTFTPDTDGDYTYRTDARDLHITLMARKGLLPEADFYCPLPYTPLEIATPARIAAMAAGPGPGVADLFDLIKAEIGIADPGYAGSIGLEGLTPELFAEVYFARRLGKDQFALAAANLAEVRENLARQHTVPWRYTILRLHEALSPLVPLMTPEQRMQFNNVLKPVFVDNYAAVPPRTIARLLALHAAGVLEVRAVKDASAVQRQPGKRGATLKAGRKTLRFDTLIDARGQQPQVLADLPFPTLRRQIGGDEEAAVALDATLQIRDSDGVTLDGVFLPAVPYLLHTHPFAQGITVSDDLAAVVADALLAREAAMAGRDFRSAERAMDAAGVSPAA
jgi:uncharacterized NAD(P)/FAD-binding protein YdhS